MSIRDTVWSKVIFCPILFVCYYFVVVFMLHISVHIKADTTPTHKDTSELIDEILGTRKNEDAFICFCCWKIKFICIDHAS